MRLIFRDEAPIVGKIHSYFAGQQSAARGRSTREDAAVPPPAHVARMLTAAFWASLHREEGWPTRLSLAYFAEGNRECSFSFSKPLPLAPKHLAKVAPAVERSGIHLVVAPDHAGDL